MVKLFTFALVLCSALVFAQRVTHRDPRYLAELSSGGGGSEPVETLWYDTSFGMSLRATSGVFEVLFWTNKGTFTDVANTGPDYLSGVTESSASQPRLPVVDSNFISGLPAIRMWVVGGNWGNNLLSSGQLSNTVDGSWSNAEVYVVVRTMRSPPSGTTSSNSFLMFHHSAVTNQGGSGAPTQIIPWSDATFYEPFGSALRRDGIVPAVISTNWVIYNVITRPNFYQIRQNGNLIYSGTTNTVKWWWGSYRLGRGDPVTQIWQLGGWIAEFKLFANQELSSDNRLTQMQYFTNKFGATNFPSLALTNL